MGELGRKFLHKLPHIEILRNLESPFIVWIQIDIYFLASTNSQPHCIGFRGHTSTSSACSGADVLRGTTIRFQYVVAVGDEDTDGLSIPANGILLNGGKITDVWGNSAVLTHSALATQSGHKIDGILPQLAATGGVVVDGSMLTLSWSEDVIVDPYALLSLSPFSITGNDEGAGLILSTPRMLESVNSGAQRGAGGHVGLIGATLPT